MLSAAGVPGISENIRVRSVVGRFLEHSRLYYFHNAGQEEIYLGSADLMPRNLDRRVEVLFPVLNRQILRWLRDVLLEKYLADNVKVRIGKADGTYDFTPVHGKGAIDSQAWFGKHRSDGIFSRNGR